MKANAMTFFDCLPEAALAAVDQDVPAWLLPTVIANRAELLSRDGPSSDAAMN